MASRCGCSSVGAIGTAMVGTDCVSVAGAGTSASPFEVELSLNVAVDNLLECSESGLYAPAPEMTSDNDTLTLTPGAGIGDTDFAIAIDGTNLDNQIYTTVGEGLYVPLFANMKMIGVGSALVGGAPPTPADEFIWLTQEGTHVDTTNVAGHIVVVFPVSFPTGVLSIQYSIGDNPGVLTFTSIEYSTVTLAAFNVVMQDDAGLPIVGGTYRVNWRATGWETI